MPTSDNQTSVALPTSDTNVSSSTTPAPSSPPSPPVSTDVTRTMQHESQSPGLLEVLGRGHRAKKPSILLKEFITNTAQTTTPPPPLMLIHSPVMIPRRRLQVTLYIRSLITYLHPCLLSNIKLFL